MRRRKGKKKKRTGRNQTRRREKSTQRHIHLSEVCILWARISNCFNSNFLAQLVRIFVGPLVSPLWSSVKTHISVWKRGVREGWINAICDHAETPLTLSSFNIHAFTLLFSFRLFTYQIIYLFIYLFINLFIH